MNNKVKLGSVCSFYSGTGFPLQYQGNTQGKYPFYKVGDISRNYANGSRYLSDAEHYIDDEVLYTIKGQIIPANTVVFAKIGEAVKLNRRAITSEECLIDNNATGIKPNESQLDLDYFFHFMCQLKLEKYAEATTVPSVKKSSMEKLEIPLLPLNEQKEIAKILDKVTALIALRKKQLEKLDELVKARFIEMFLNGNYPTVKISDLVSEKIQSAKKVFRPEDVIKYIDISSIDNKKNVMTGYTEYVFSEAPSRAQQHIKKNDIVVSLVRPNLRNVAITDFNAENLVASSGFCVLRAEKCFPSYLMAIVCSDQFTDDMSKLVTGANYPAIKNSDIMNYTVALPPIGLQTQFATFVAQTDKSKSAIQKSLEQLETLKKSLMQKYFG